MRAQWVSSPPATPPGEPQDPTLLARCEEPGPPHLQLSLQGQRVAGPVPSRLSSVAAGEERVNEACGVSSPTPPRCIFSRQGKAEGEECQDALTS